MEGFYYIDKTGLITELLENLQHGARYAVWKRDSGHTFAELSASGTRGARNGQKENFCHGVLLGLLRYREDRLEEDGIGTVIRYGIACCRKRCRVVTG